MSMHASIPANSSRLVIIYIQCFRKAGKTSKQMQQKTGKKTKQKQTNKKKNTKPLQALEPFWLSQQTQRIVLLEIAWSDLHSPICITPSAVIKNSLQLVWLRKVKDSWTLTKKEQEIKIDSKVYLQCTFVSTYNHEAYFSYVLLLSTKSMLEVNKWHCQRDFMISVFPQLKVAFTIWTWILHLNSNRLCYCLFES